jgi:hypothetical protein
VDGGGGRDEDGSTRGEELANLRNKNKGGRRGGLSGVGNRVEASVKEALPRGGVCLPYLCPNSSCPKSTVKIASCRHFGVCGRASRAGVADENGGKGVCGDGKMCYDSLFDAPLEPPELDA